MRSLGAEEAMPCWYYDKKELRTSTPSVRDGIDPDVESRYRKEGARFIMDTGAKMGLKHYETLATGMVYFHRFYMQHSFKQFPRFVTACCCLFLAGKVEETPKKCKDIIKAARSLLTDQQFAQFGEDPKEEVMTLERILLQTIKFDLQVEHPYKFLLKYCKSLKGDREKLEAMLQMAWTFVNDSLFTTLCLQWEPEIIAIALMYLAGKLSKFEVTDWASRQLKHQRWWDMFVEDISMELLEDVCHQVLDLYSNSSNPTDSPPPTPPTSAANRVVAGEVQSSGGSAPPGQPHMSAARKHKLPSPSVQPKPMAPPDGPKQLITDHQPPPPPQPISTVSHHGHPQAIQALGDSVPSHVPPLPPTTVVPGQAMPPVYKYGGQPSLPMDTYGAPPPPQYRITSVNSGYGHTGYPPPDVADGAPPGQYGQPPAIPPTSAPPPSFMQGYDVPGYPPGYNPPPLPSGHQVAPMPPPPPPFSGQYMGDGHYGAGMQQPPPPPPPPQIHPPGQYQHPPPQPPHYPQPPPNYPPHLGQQGHYPSQAGYMDGSQARLPPPPPPLQDHMGQIQSQSITPIRFTERQGSRQNWGV